VGQLYEPESESFKYLKTIMDSFYLVNVLENDFVEGDLEKAFEPIFEKLTKYSLA